MGGYVSAIRAGQLGLDVTLVEKDAYGGACLNRGCIPSKALITASGVAHDARTAQEMGINAEILIDIERMIEWKTGVVEKLTGGVKQLCRANGVNLVEGRAEFINESEVRISGGQSTAPERIAFDHAVIADGESTTATTRV